MLINTYISRFARDTSGAVSSHVAFVAICCTVTTMVITAQTLMYGQDQSVLADALQNTQEVSLTRPAVETPGTAP